MTHVFAPTSWLTIYRFLADHKQRFVISAQRISTKNDLLRARSLRGRRGSLSSAGGMLSGPLFPVQNASSMLAASRDM
jgi:hypothetical protein